MADQFINALSVTWNSALTVFNAIKMNVTDSASAAASKLIDLQVNTVSKFSVDKTGAVSATSYLPPSNDGAALGVSGTAFSDVFLASGGVINFAAGDVTVTHSSNALTFGGASSGYLFDAAPLPATDDGAALGSTAKKWSDAFFASGAVLNFNSGDVAVTHSAGILTVGTGDLRVTTAGTNSASVVTVGGTQTLSNKSFSSIAINGTVGATTPNTGAFTTLSASGLISANGGQIDFPSTQNPSAGANTLDDYEEGTYSPTISATTGTISSAAATSTHYTKIGRLVSFAVVAVITTNGTGAGAVKCTVPVTSSNLGIAMLGGILRLTVGGKQLSGNGISATEVGWTLYDNTYPGSTGTALVLAGVYIV